MTTLHCLLFVAMVLKASAQEKPGSCDVAYENLFTATPSTCSSDNDCAGSQKCCSLFPVLSAHHQVTACTTAGPACGPNEHLSRRGAVYTCDDVRQGRSPQVLSTIGSSMCFCDNGYARRNSSGPCVPVEQCAACKENEVPTECENQCDTCDRVADGIQCGPSCSGSKCACAPGYRRAYAQGPCIPEGQCLCAANEEFRRCTNPCAQSCQERNPSCFMSWKQCKPGCDCKPGFIRDKTSGRCVEPERCVVLRGCGENEMLTRCPSPCPATCASPNPTCAEGVQCRPHGEEVCECKPGFLRLDANGPCVKAEQCGRSNCAANQVLKSCPNICPATCEFPNPPKCLYPDCEKRFGCECAPGFVLSAIDGACIPSDKCDFKCGINESPVECLDPHPRTCKDPAPPVYPVDRCTRGCACLPGYVRDVPGTGRCVTLDSCKKQVAEN